jgi:parallel beta-helix repeat protein
MDTTDECVIQGNRLVSNKEGIRANKSKATIRNNNISTCASNGITIREYSKVVIERNTIYDISYWGIQVSDHSSASVFFNSIHDSSASGVRIADNSSADIEKNRIYKNRHCGIIIDTANRVVVRHNAIRKNNSAVRATKVTSLTIEENDLRENQVGMSITDAERIFRSGNKGEENSEPV